MVLAEFSVSNSIFLPIANYPLLLLQWLDEYSRNCVIELIMRNYCTDTAVGYTFDQSIAIYGLYICVLMAIIIGNYIKSMPIKNLHTLYNQNVVHYLKLLTHYF